MAIRLDGKQIAAEIRESLKQKVDEIRKTVPDFSPGLAIVQEIVFLRVISAVHYGDSKIDRFDKSDLLTDSKGSKNS